MVDKLKMLFRFSISGLWLSVPLLVLSVICLLTSNQTLAAFIWISLLVSLPWGIPAWFFLMAWGYGGSVLWFFPGAILLILAVSINGALIRRALSSMLRKKRI